MAGSLDGRARRVRRLEGRGLERPAPSRTELEARALDAEIRELKEEIRALGEDPDECHPDVRMDLPLDEAIAELEKEVATIEEEMEQC
jgi:predicted RNase H-like nuclease (RuvC/YqgF family)